MKELSVGEFEKIASGVYLEGLSVDYKRNVIWYSDVITGGVHGIKPDGSKLQSLNPSRMWTGGVMMNEDGAVLSSGPGGIMWNNPDTGKSGWLIDTIDGKPINGINEMMPDGTGGIYFGTNDIEMIEKGQPTRPSALYRLTVDRQVIKVADGIGFTNGIMLSPDRKQLYCNDTFTCTWAFDVQPDLSLTNKRKLVDKEDVDGMALDAEGTLWITGFRSNFFTRVRPDGTKLPPVQTPAGASPQIRFGGKDMRDYYLCAVPLNAGDTLKEGGSLNEHNSFVYRGRSDVPGMPISPARFKLG